MWVLVRPKELVAFDSRPCRSYWVHRRAINRDVGRGGIFALVGAGRALLYFRKLLPRKSCRLQKNVRPGSVEAVCKKSPPANNSSRLICSVVLVWACVAHGQEHPAYTTQWANPAACWALLPTVLEYHAIPRTLQVSFVQWLFNFSHCAGSSLITITVPMMDLLVGGVWHCALVAE